MLNGNPFCKVHTSRHRKGIKRSFLLDKVEDFARNRWEYFFQGFREFVFPRNNYNRHVRFPYKPVIYVLKGCNMRRRWRLFLEVRNQILEGNPSKTVSKYFQIPRSEPKKIRNKYFRILKSLYRRYKQKRRRCARNLSNCGKRKSRAGAHE